MKTEFWQIQVNTKSDFFFILALFFTRSSPNLGTTIQLKLRFPINMEEGYLLKKLRLDKLKITVFKSNCRKTVSSYVFCKKPLKAHGNRMGTMVKKPKKYLINFTFYETFKDQPIPHKNFMFLP